jgi:DNA ligase (NAD+)
MGAKSAQNLLDEIDKSRSRDLSHLLYALGIRHVGERTAGALASRFQDMESLAQASLEELTQIEDVGPKVAESIRFFFRQPSNTLLISRLKEAGLSLSSARKTQMRKIPLEGRSFVLTGKLSGLTRDEAREKIEALGGLVTNSVSKNTTYLVVGEEPGSKFQRAKELGIPVLEETEFLKLIEE